MNTRYIQETDLTNNHENKEDFLITHVEHTILDFSPPPLVRQDKGFLIENTPRYFAVFTPKNGTLTFFHKPISHDDMTIPQISETQTNQL